MSWRSFVQPEVMVQTEIIVTVEKLYLALPLRVPDFVAAGERVLQPGRARFLSPDNNDVGSMPEGFHACMLLSELLSYGVRAGQAL